MKWYIRVFSILVFFVIIIIESNYLMAQVSEAWASRYNGPGSGIDKSNAIAVDSDGNVFVTGSSQFSGFGTEDFSTIKYDPSGTELWVNRYSATVSSYDIAHAIAIDKEGFIYVTGESNYDFLTIKYSSAGDTIWTQRYNGPKFGKDIPYAITLDDTGNVYITGESEGTTGTHGIFEDYATIKYSTDGAFKWVSRYNGPAGDYDRTNSIALDEFGNVYVTGTSDGGSSGSGTPHFDYATIKYNNAGVFQWVRRYNGSANSSDEAKLLKIDISGNIVVTGSSTNSGADDDYLTIKYTPAGDTLWISKYDGTGNNSDIANCVALDDLGNTFVTGKSYGGSISDFDIITIKYDAFGDSVWVRRYNGEADDIDEGIGLAVDKTGNVFVAGYSSNVMTAFDYTTIKYIPDGTEDWTIKYTNSDFAGSSEEPTGMFVDTLSNIYITGMSALDYATVKYIQTPTSVGSTSPQIPDVFSLEQNYPNPFNPTTAINFSIPNEELVSLKVFNSLGEEVADLVNETKPAGNYHVEFIVGRSAAADSPDIASGIYFYKISAGSFTVTKKMILLK